MRILNLYAGIGCNRALWGNEHEIVAIENNGSIAELYKYRFPGDLVLVQDAHEYLRNNFKDFDFIWSSVPCPTHSKIWHSMKNVREIPYPDMRLYQEIIFLTNWYNGKWVVENVDPYYEPLTRPKAILGRHMVWSSDEIRYKGFPNTAPIRRATKEELKEYHNIGDDLFDMMVQMFGGDARTLLRNGVHELIGKHIFNELFVKRSIRNKF